MVTPSTNVDTTASLGLGILSITDVNGANTDDKMYLSLDSVNNRVVVKANSDFSTGEGINAVDNQIEVPVESITEHILFKTARGNDLIHVDELNFATKIVIESDAGNDDLKGGAGNDVFKGGANKDVLTGGAGNDDLKGGAGNDVLTGGIGNDDLKGRAGKDVLTGGIGNDIMIGGAGKDVMTGGAGKDVMTGGASNDTFALSKLTDSLAPDFDVIKDLKIGVDIIDAPSAVSADDVIEFGTIAASSNPNTVLASLGANQATTYTYGTGTFLVINDATIGYDATKDAMIEITGFTGNLDNLAIV
ncbi:hypothetical protein NIES4102_25650 [Chondrocystis sp. NIES-4102]|nr:hypothetical protein NIES4102_25650 [Chondrocystis sp. NIES-4102]